MSKENFYGRRTNGDFMSIGDSPKDFIDVLPIRRQVYLAAKSHLCPVPDEVIEYYSEKYAAKHPKMHNPDRIRRGGMRMAIARYLECNFAMKHVILASAEEHNPLLYKRLKTPVKRIPGELPNPNLNKKYLPEGFDEEMTLGSTLYGYGLNRILLAQYGENRGEHDQRTQDRIVRGLKAVDRVAKRYNQPLMFMVKLAEEVVNLDADPERVLYHMLSASFLKEEGCKQMFVKTMRYMRKCAPKLQATYGRLIGEKGIDGVRKMGIVVREDLE